jgi:hypothetical protein
VATRIWINLPKAINKPKCSAITKCLKLLRCPSTFFAMIWNNMRSLWDSISNGMFSKTGTVRKRSTYVFKCSLCIKSRPGRSSKACGHTSFEVMTGCTTSGEHYVRPFILQWPPYFGLCFLFLVNVALSILVVVWCTVWIPKENQAGQTQGPLAAHWSLKPTILVRGVELRFHVALGTDCTIVILTTARIHSVSNPIKEAGNHCR